MTSFFILKHSAKKAYALITFLPGVFMFFTTLVAGTENIFHNYLPKHTIQGNINAGLSCIMIILVMIISWKSAKKAAGLLSGSYR